MIYTQVTVAPYLPTREAILTAASTTPVFQGGKAEVINGQEFVSVTPPTGSNGPMPILGSAYKITGASGLNLVGMCITTGTATGPFLFEIGG